jgi:long-chain acyl-CoA synthetase
MMLKLSKIMPKFIRRIIFYPVLRQFGGRLNMVTLGGAKTDKDVQEVFSAFGLDVIEGYGLTETVGPVTINSAEHNYLGTSGSPMKDVDIKLTDEGEILIKADVVFQGYYNKPELNRKIFDKQGYFKTGDIADFDENNCLVLKGRQKFRIVLPSGEKVYPEDIEYKLKEIPEITEACVFSLSLKGFEEVSAAIIPKDKNANLDEIIIKANKLLETSQTIKNYVRWREDDFPRTSTLKLKRQEIAAKTEEIIKIGEKSRAEQENDASEQASALKKIISTVCMLPADSIKEDMKLIGDLKLDSLKRLSLLTLIEEEFSVDVDETEIQEKTTIKELEQIIKKSPKSKLRLSKHLGWQFNPIICFLRHIAGTYIIKPIFMQFTNIKIIGKENIAGQAIYVSNHPGVYDLFYLLNTLGKLGKKYFVLADKYHWQMPYRIVHQPVLEFLGGAVPIDPKGEQDLDKSLTRTGNLVEAGFSVALSPQGRYTYSEKDVKDIRGGTAYIVKATDLPIIPSYIDEKFTKNFDPRKRLKYFPRFNRGGSITIKIGKPFNIPSYFSDEEANKLIWEKILALKQDK